MISKLVYVYKRLFWSDEKYARKIGVQIGNGCSIATRFFGSEPYLIEIGDYVQVTKEDSFFNHGGAWVFRKEFPKFDYFGKIKVGNNVYIGNRTLVMPGVTIGDNVIIGAGSVITKSVSSNSVVAGVPARVIGGLVELQERLLPYNLNTKGLSYEDKKSKLLSLNDDLFITK
ncbi:MAG: acyltransferase [Labilibaculum sp.]|nr:acyltransferase [Labilibaculum sp.]MBI9059642.1 acyltransferase [Labilibaculum sp.]